MSIGNLPGVPSPPKLIRPQWLLIPQVSPKVAQTAGPTQAWASGPVPSGLSFRVGVFGNRAAE